MSCPRCVSDPGFAVRQRRVPAAVYVKNFGALPGPPSGQPSGPTTGRIGRPPNTGPSRSSKNSLQWFLKSMRKLPDKPGH
jgi:hypothetical protein